MAQNVIINGVTYSNVPEVDIPKSGGGTAKFYDSDRLIRADQHRILKDKRHMEGSNGIQKGERILAADFRSGYCD